jgi:hypothetical protein
MLFGNTRLKVFQQVELGSGITQSSHQHLVEGLITCKFNKLQLGFKTVRKNFFLYSSSIILKYKDQPWDVPVGLFSVFSRERREQIDTYSVSVDGSFVLLRIRTLFT